MKKIIFFLLATLSLCISINAQTTATSPTPAPQTTEAKPKRPPVFRANKVRLININNQQ